MSNNNLLSIQEFADAAGVTPQAVYKRLNQEELKPFITIIENKKFLSKEALNLFTNDVKQVNQQSLQTELIELLKAQISSLTEENQQLRNTNQQLTNSLIDLTARCTELTAAQLFIINKPKKSLLPWKRKKEER